ncbi:MAG: DUF2207 domain-containing protein [Erysipelotrichaceae bacterium]
MKTLKFLSSLLLVGLCFLTSFEEAKAAETFTIQDYNIEMEVHQNGVFDLQESLDVNFFEPSRGIYRSIPTFYSVDLEDEGGIVKRDFFFPIRNINSNTTQSIDQSPEGVVIRLGDPDIYLEGLQQYEINYEMVSKPLGLSQDYLYFNLIGAQWAVPIENVSFTLHFEQAIDFSKFKLFYGGLGSTNQIAQKCSYDEATFEVFCSGISLQPYEALTVQAPLGSYFSYPTHAAMYGFLGIFAAILLLGCVLIWIRYGKDLPLIQPVNFAPPEGINSAMCGYVINMQSDTRDLVSLILEWGKEGWIEIHDEQGDLRLVKKQNLPQDVPRFELDFFNALFANRDEVVPSALETGFHQDVQNAKMRIRSYFQTKPHEFYNRKSKQLQIALLWLITLPMASLLAFQMYVATYIWWLGLIAFVVVMVVLLLIGALAVLIKEHAYLNKKSMTLGYIALLAIAVALVTMLYGAMLSIFDGQAWMGILGALFYTGSLLVSLFVDQRSEYGNRLLGDVLGLKNFIEVAEEDRLKMLVKDNPMLFYDVLPYAYAFNMTDVWQEHFKGIDLPQPTYYYGAPDITTFLLLRNLTYSMNRVSTSMNTVPAPKGGSVSGGFSGGGGGFSGGGFGGGGGGSW